MQIIACSHAKHLGNRIIKFKNCNLISSNIFTFSLSEYCIQIQDKLNLSEPLYIIQLVKQSVNDSLIELLMTIYAAQEIGIKDIRVILPYMPYSRQNRSIHPNSLIGIKFIAHLFDKLQVNSIITLDLHNLESAKFFVHSDSIVNIETTNLFIQFLIKDLDIDLDKSVIISPDSGSKMRAEKIAKFLSLPCITIQKTRHNHSVEMKLEGDFTGKTCIIIDDIIDSGKTLSLAAEHLSKLSASEIYACSTHLISTKSLQYIFNHTLIKKIITTNSCNNFDNFVDLKLEVLDISKLLAETL